MPALRYARAGQGRAQTHPHAEHTAEAAEAAGAQGRFWEMRDTLFEQQRALDDAHPRLYAESLGLDLGQFDDEMGRQVHAGRVREDFVSGVRSGVNGTPTFSINAVRHDGSYDLARLLQAIEAAAGQRACLANPHAAAWGLPVRARRLLDHPGAAAGLAGGHAHASGCPNRSPLTTSPNGLRRFLPRPARRAG